MEDKVIVFSSAGSRVEYTQYTIYNYHDARICWITNCVGQTIKRHGWIKSTSSPMRKISWIIIGIFHNIVVTFVVIFKIKLRKVLIGIHRPKKK